MHFTFPLLACLASMSVATPIATPSDLAPRDTLILDRAISRAQTALTNLGKSIDGYHMAPNRNAVSQQRLINDDAQVLVDALVQGTQSIRTGPTVTHLERTGAIIKAKELLNNIRKVSDAWVRAKSLIVANGGRQAIGDVVKKQANASNAFAAALVTKISGGDTDGLAGWYEMEVDQAVRKAVFAFN